MTLTNHDYGFKFMHISTTKNLGKNVRKILGKINNNEQD